MSSETLVKCGHPPCQCLVEAEQFCSAKCATARGASRGPCMCGHEDCVAGHTGLEDYETEHAKEDEDLEVGR